MLLRQQNLSFTCQFTPAAAAAGLDICLLLTIAKQAIGILLCFEEPQEVLLLCLPLFSALNVSPPNDTQSHCLSLHLRSLAAAVSIPLL